MLIWLTSCCLFSGSVCEGFGSVIDIEYGGYAVKYCFECLGVVGLNVDVQRVLFYADVVLCSLVWKDFVFSFEDRFDVLSLCFSLNRGCVH